VHEFLPISVDRRWLRKTVIVEPSLPRRHSILRSETEFKDWHASSDILDGYSCIFRDVDRSLYPEHFGYARWFHEGDSFPMLQCVWPDKSIRFPWEPDFNSQLISSQPILAAKSALRFADNRDTAAITTQQVIEKDYPILVVFHDEDGDWQFVCGTIDETDDGRIVALHEIVKSHPSVIESFSTRSAVHV